MLRVTIDAFSGRPNPSYIISNSEEVRELLKDISRKRGAITDVNTGYSGLGFRGAILEFLSDGDHQAFELPRSFKVGGGSSQNEAKGQEIAERLIRSMSKYTLTARSNQAITFDSSLKGHLLNLLDQSVSVRTKTQIEGDTSNSTTSTTSVNGSCSIETAPFNPDFWNTLDVMPHNNCYNYASNTRTDTFAQPGRGAGQMYTSLTCAEVTRAAIADGMHQQGNCFPQEEAPRWLVAMVVAPGIDYHWYRLQQEGFWGHKPGQTAARNTDNSGVVITNPETCDRGMYTDFCGYFYSSKTQQNTIQ